MNKPTIDFLLTIDTEEEGNWGGNYFRHDKSPVENIKHLPAFQDFCNKLGIRPTYLIDYPVATKDFSVKILKSFLDDGACEIGAHLHPWCNPPYEEEINLRNTYLHNLPQELQLKKLSVLTETIQDNFKIRPVSYRAGRYAFNAQSLPMLESLDYQVDSSIVPYRVAKTTDEPSFGMTGLNPYHPDYVNILKPGTAKIIELPVTVEFTRRLPGWFKANYNGLPNIGIRRILKKLFQIDLIWLRPSYSSVADMIRLCDSSIKQGVTVLNMMFHSNELMPGGSPYNKTEADVERFLNKIEKLIGYLAEHYQLKFNTLKDFGKTNGR